MINLAGKTAVVFGLANKRSIAWGIAQRLHEAGATLAICYQNERMKLEAEGLIADLPGANGFQCDVSSDAEIESVFATIKEKYGKIDTLVHAIAFAPAAELKGDFLNTSREGFRVAMDVSVYSLIAVSRGAAPLMTEGGSIMTMTYYAAEKVVPNYNVMAIAKAGLESAMRYLAANLGPRNIRVNAISAGPIRTLSSAGSIPARRSGSGTNFWGVREYHVGDPLRRLDWTFPPPSPARCCTWIAATTLWGTERRDQGSAENLAMRTPMPRFRRCESTRWTGHQGFLNELRTDYSTEGRPARAMAISSAGYS